MNELFIKELICKTKDFLDNNQRIKIEEILTVLGKEAYISKVYLHKFRRTMATNASRTSLKITRTYKS